MIPLASGPTPLAIDLAMRVRRCDREAAEQWLAEAAAYRPVSRQYEEGADDEPDLSQLLER